MKPIVAIALLCLPLAAAAQTVYRCEADGRVSYGEARCTGAGRTVDVDDKRPAADIEAARDVAARERDLAERLRDERLRRETAAAVKPVAMDRRAAAKPVPPPAQLQRPPAARGTSRAAGPSIRRARG